MDLDAFVTEHAAQWRRLEQLSRRRVTKLSADEVDELVMLYQRTATHLSAIKSRSPDPALLARLSRLVLLARGAITGGRQFHLGRLAGFFVRDFPAALYRARYSCLGTAIAFLAASFGIGAYFAQHPDKVGLFLSGREIDDLVNHDFAAYYSQYAASHFAAGVWTNNAWLTALCLASGVLIVPVLYVLYNNAFSIGLIGAVMVTHGRADVFFGLIAPHGLLELTCIFIGAGVGLRMAWAWIAPGPVLTRGQALTAAARDGITAAIGLVVVLAVSGLLEAFVTPAPLPIAVRIAVGASVWMAFLVYIAVLGRSAARSVPAEDE